MAGQEKIKELKTQLCDVLLNLEVYQQQRQLLTNQIKQEMIKEQQEKAKQEDKKKK